MIVAFIDDNRDELGVEPICRVLQVAPSTYYAANVVVQPSARAVRDAVLMQALMVLWVANRRVYGAHKLWKAARRRRSRHRPGPGRPSEADDGDRRDLPPAAQGVHDDR